MNYASRYQADHYISNQWVVSSFGVNSLLALFLSIWNPLIQKKSSFSWNVFPLAFRPSNFAARLGFPWMVDAFAIPCILLALFIRRSKESACLVYMAKPADDATTPAMINIAIVLSFSFGGEPLVVLFRDAMV